MTEGAGFCSSTGLACKSGHRPHRQIQTVCKQNLVKRKGLHSIGKPQTFCRVSRRMLGSDMTLPNSKKRTPFFAVLEFYKTTASSSLNVKENH